jgi:hypothetical protein
MHALAVRDNHGCCRLSRRRIVLFHEEILAVQGAGKIIIRIDPRTVSCIRRTIAGTFVREDGVNRFFAGIRSDTND